MTGLTLKERLSERLAEYPLLRTMLLNPWFALALTGVVLLGVSVVACLPKVWRCTPKDFRPEIRVSLLDLMQARALQASAERKASQGNHLEAATAWQSALGNNPGSVELCRSALRHLSLAPELPARSIGRALGSASWLVRLGGTNQADLALIATVLDKYGMSEEVYGLLNSMTEDLSPGLEAAYLKSLFVVGKYDEFGARWETVKDSLPQDEDLALYRTAYLAGWGPPGQAPEQLAQLKLAMDDVLQGPLACRLLMAVSRKTLDAPTYAAALERQREASRDRIADHTEYWHLLRTAGRRDDARRLAREFNRPPQSPYDVVTTAEALQALDLQDECLSYLERHAGEFGGANNRWSAAVWATYADLLITRRDWEGLKNVATQMRSIPGAHQVLAGFSRFLDGRAALATGAVPAAEAAFRDAVAAGFPLGRVGIRVSNSLLQMGYADLALQALAPLESTFENDLAYWKAAFDAAYARREDDVWLLKAASRAHEIAPQDVEWQFNYAAALLIGHWRLPEALRLTWSLLNAYPESVGAQINHAIALLLNGRDEDAATLLDKVNYGQLVGQQVPAYHIAAAGVNRYRQDWPRLRADLRALDNERLFPKQRAWLNELRQAIPASVAASATATEAAPAAATNQP